MVGTGLPQPTIKARTASDGTPAHWARPAMIAELPDCSFPLQRHAAWPTGSAATRCPSTSVGGFYGSMTVSAETSKFRHKNHAEQDCLMGWLTGSMPLSPGFGEQDAGGDRDVQALDRSRTRDADMRSGHAGDSG